MECKRGQAGIMPGVKIIDKDPGLPKRRLKLWETFGKIELFPLEIKDGKGSYYAIVNNNQLETNR